MTDNDSVNVRLQRGETIVAGNKLIRLCGYCMEPVQVNKFLLGSLHVCANPPETQ